MLGEWEKLDESRSLPVKQGKLVGLGIAPNGKEWPSNYPGLPLPGNELANANKLHLLIKINRPLNPAINKTASPPSFTFCENETQA